MADKWTDDVRIFFKDGSSTVLSVRKTEDIQAVIAQECERNGWNTKDVINFTIEGTANDE
jgi:hypothetical protein